MQRAETLYTVVPKLASSARIHATPVPLARMPHLHYHLYRQCRFFQRNTIVGAALCLVLLTAPLGWAQKMSRVTPVRMEDSDHRMVAVSCQVNGGSRRYVCVIDSGATNTIVSDRVLKADGPLIEMTTGNGVVRVHQRDVSLTLADGLELKSKAFVQSMMPQGVDILVGQDVLRQFRFVILDYETRQVEFQW